MSSCTLCGESGLRSVYRVERAPVFQNKRYRTEAEARKAQAGSIELVQCLACGFVFNRRFDATLVVYDESYQNDQSASPFFRRYLAQILELLTAELPPGSKVVEIGCGKGYFLDLLAGAGFAVAGYDPAYEGDNPAIRKHPFHESRADLGGDLIVLRHTLEHVTAPRELLKCIAEANRWRGKIFVEVPCFDWVVSQGAFLDIFYEHCNYFSPMSLQSMFAKAGPGRVFNGQYIYVLAELEALRTRIVTGAEAPSYDVGALEARYRDYRAFLADRGAVWVWGAAGKGTTFVNRVDPDRQSVLGLADIDPKKQGLYVGGTGHEVIAPEQVDLSRSQTVIVMNPNYAEEVEAHFRQRGHVEIHRFGDPTT